MLFNKAGLPEFREICLKAGGMYISPGILIQYKACLSSRDKWRQQFGIDNVRGHFIVYIVNSIFTSLICFIEKAELMLVWKQTS